MNRRIALVVLILGLGITGYAQTDDWKQLFDGKDLIGWKHVGPGFMTVEDGLIRTHGGMGLLYWTGGKLGDCTIRVVYKLRDRDDNSGVFIRIPIEPSNGCPCIMATKSRSSIAQKRSGKTSTTQPECCTR